MDPITGQQELLAGTRNLLGGYYGAVALLNAGGAVAAWRSRRRLASLAAVAFAATVGFLAYAALSGDPAYNAYVTLPSGFRDFVDSRLAGPVAMTLGSFATLGVMFVFRRFFVRPTVAWILLNAALLMLGLSLADRQFAAIVLKPDNVPIVAMVFLLGFFTWLATSKALANDDALRRGLPPLEKGSGRNVLVWPDLVYIELIAMVMVSTLLLVWAIGLKAPLEEPANPALTPNPSKAPWYFLGLQEMLVYFDPWMIGVVVPGVIVVGLMAIPFIDSNRLGSGYYTIDQRKRAYLIFQFGFLQLWIVTILLGTFFRGPNWNFFGPYEVWDVHKVPAITNVNLSQYFWEHLLNRPRPMPGDGVGSLAAAATIVLRELPGILALAAYFVALPCVLARTALRDYRAKAGRARYVVMVGLLLLMVLLPVKMVLRWTCDLSYIVHFPEISLSL